MNSTTRPTYRSVLLALGCALGLAFALAPAMNAADAPKALPVTVTFEKVAVKDAPPYVAKLTNTSKESLKVSVKVRLSVAAHPMEKSRNVPDQVIEAGKTASVPNLAVGDKLTLTAAGFAPLEVEVK